MRFALEHQNPLITGIVTGGATYPERNFSLLMVSDPNILLWALKPAEEGIAHGGVARVWNLSAEPGTVDLSPAFPLLQARRTTHIETDLEEATIAENMLRAPIRGRQLLTFRLRSKHFQP
jgi:alpha-mannosidase